MTERPGELDPIDLEIVFNALKSVADETFIALMKSAYSTNIKERRDHSTAIMDVDGRLIVQAEASLPIHIASMTGLMTAVLGKYGGDIRPGDMFIANDPYAAGGSHLPDINLALPVFSRGRPLGFVCNIAHHADVGGMAPGSMAGGMSEIFQEGLRLPAIRLFREGELQRDLLDLILLNVRLPEERRGDYYAQIAAGRLGERRVAELVEGWGEETLLAAFSAIVARTAARMRDAIRAVPDGVYRFEDVMDDDGLGTADIPIRSRIEVEDDAIRFDFAGTAAQVRGNINVPLNATRAAVCYTLKALLDPDAPNNQGMLDIPDIAAPEGSLLNARFPAPVAARANTCQRVVDVIVGALADALPEAAVAAANGANTTAVFSGIDPRTGRAISISRRWAEAAADGRRATAGTASRSTSPTPRTCRSRRSRRNTPAGGKLRFRRGLRRSRQATGRPRAAPGDRARRSPLHVQRRRRALRASAVGAVRRRRRGERSIRVAGREGRPDPPRRQAERDRGRTPGGRSSSNPRARAAMAHPSGAARRRWPATGTAASSRPPISPAIIRGAVERNRPRGRGRSPRPAPAPAAVGGRYFPWTRWRHGRSALNQ